MFFHLMCRNLVGYSLVQIVLRLTNLNYILGAPNIYNTVLMRGHHTFETVNLSTL